MIKIDFADSKDVPFIIKGMREICVIEKQSHDSESEQIKTVRSAIRKHEIRKASVKGEVVGFVHFRFTKKNPYGIDYGDYDRKFCWIEWMYVSKAWRKKGVATLLHDDLVSICKKNRIKEIMLDVFDVNKVATKFYKKRSFSEFIRILKEDIR